MEAAENKYIALAYKLYTMEDGEKDLFEETKDDQPFIFISGLGLTLDKFESQVISLAQNEKFEFTIAAQDAYGEYDDKHVVELPKSIFEIDGQFDNKHVNAGSVVPLMTSDGQRVNGTVVEVKPDVVVIDLNHPLAGADLIFSGEIIENRLATTEELQQWVNAMSSEQHSCGGDCCGGDCGGECDGEHGCGDECNCGKK